MLQSKLFFKTEKNISQEEISKNAQLLIRAGFVDKLSAGIYSILPLGWRVMKKIENIIREEMNAIGGQEVFLPSLHPKKNWEQTGRWDTMDDLYKIKTSDKEFALGTTHEEIISPLVKKKINSYKDLPLYLYQIQNKFRNEKRAKSGLLRGREFLMKDLYSFHANEEDLNDYYEKTRKAYENIFERCGLKDKTYFTYASGGSFSKYSHEFQTLTLAGEDNIYICDKCKIAMNEEILADQNNKCPECGNKDLKKEKAVEVGNIFKLMAKFSKPFGLNYLDKNGKEKEVLMGCYGIGLQRLMGTIVEIYNDENGIVWPRGVAPFEVHILAIKSRNNEVKKQAEALYKKLTEQDFEVLYDDRENASAGQKFTESDLVGIPYRVVVSDRTLSENKYEVKKRNEKEAKMVDEDGLLDVLK